MYMFFQKKPEVNTDEQKIEELSLMLLIYNN